MITYTYPLPENPSVRVPKLHRIKYNPKYNWGEVQYWCRENCKNPAYTSPGWANEKFVEFEDDEDATLFALKFS